MNERSEQIDSRLNIIEDYDQPLLRDALYEVVSEGLHNLPRRINVLNGRLSAVEYLDSAGMRHVFLVAAVTFLGGNGNHPVFKKRIQLKTWYKKVYAELASDDTKVHFLGVYHYNGNIVFVDFDAPSFVANKMHNSSAFVYTNDLFRAMKDGHAFRIDFNGHALNTVKFSAFKDYVDGLSKKEHRLSFRGDAPLFLFFEGFNLGFPFNKWIKGEYAVRQMFEGHWPDWRQTEWAGWYLEFLFFSYARDMDSQYVKYTHAEKSPSATMLDFDVWFPVHRFYGDLKASDQEKDETPGNDQESLLEAICKYDRFWYIIYEHATEKDDKHNYSFRNFRQDFIFSKDGFRPLSPLGGTVGKKHRTLKNRVCFTRMVILELNRANMGDVLTMFNQGRQPDGKPRKKKFNIQKSKIENFQVYHFEGSS